MVATHAKFAADLNAAEQASRSAATRIAASFNAVTGAASGISRAIRVIQTALVVDLAARGFDAIIRKPLELADNIAEMAERVGIGAEKLQVLQHAAVISGGSIEDLEVGLRNLSRRVDEATSGNRNAGDLFRSLGVGVTDARGAVRDLDAILEDVADSLGRNTNATARTRQEVELFGRSGTRLHGMLAQGAEGLRAMETEARRLGLVMDESMIQKAGRANDQLDTLARVIKINLATAIAEFTATEDFSGWLKRAAEGVRGLMSDLKAWGVLSRTPAERVEELRRTIAALEQDAAKIIKGQSLGDRLNRWFGQDERVTDRVEGLRKELDALLESMAMQPVTPQAPARAAAGPTPEQLRALDDFRDKFKLASIPETETAARAIATVRAEAEKLKETSGPLAGEVDKITAAWVRLIQQNDATRRALETSGKAAASMANAYVDGVFAGVTATGDLTKVQEELARSLEDIDTKATLLAEPFDVIGEKVGVITAALAKLSAALPSDDPRIQALKDRLAALENLRKALQKLNEDVDNNQAGLQGTREAVDANEKPLEDLRRELELLDKEAVVFGAAWGGVGGTVDLTAERMDRLTAAIRKLLEEGVDPADPKIQQLKERLDGLKKQKELEDTFRGLGDVLTDSITRGAASILDGTQKIDDAFRNLVKNLAVYFLERGVKGIMDEAIKQVKRFLDYLQETGLIKSAVNLGLSLLGAAAGGSGGAVTVPSSSIQTAAKGAVIKARPGGRLIVAGEAGQDEAIVPLDGRFRGGGGSIVVNVVNQTGVQADARVEQSTGADGSRTIHVMLTRAMKEAFASGAMDETMRGMYRLNRAGTSR